MIFLVPVLRQIHEMIGNMKCGVPRRFAPLLAVCWILVLLVAQRATAQEPVSPGPLDFPDLRTSAWGPLQERLEKAFPDSFEKGVDIFWEKRDGWISPEVFDWWVRVVEDDGRQDLTWEDAQSMFRKLGPARSRVFSIRPRRRICAVVGASRNLIGSNYRELIDAHDVVIRMNRAPTVGFESEVGVKTTHHVMWPKMIGEAEFDREAFLLMTPITAGTEEVFDRIRDLVADHLRWEPGRVRLIHPEFVKYLDDNWLQGEGEYPSTGFIALMLAVHVCDEVDVFGFGATASGRWDHYYDAGPGQDAWFHPAGLEARLRRELEEKGILKVFRGSRLDIGLPTLEDDTPIQDAGEAPAH